MTAATQRRVAVYAPRADLRVPVEHALTRTGTLGEIGPDTRVALKPNLTYTYHKPGVTTSPALLLAAMQVIRERTSHVCVVESDGGYGAWTADEAFRGHGLPEIARRLDVELVNLCTEPREAMHFQSGRSSYELALPTRLLHETDVFVTLPVPKIHSMTGVSLAFKNQWGCVPDTMRLRRHHIFDDAIVAINRALRPKVLGDGLFFLDLNGPMDGTPVKMDLIIGATDPGAFDRYVSEVMRIPWHKVSHLRRAVELGDMPANLDQIQCDVPPITVSTHGFALRRTVRNWIALAGFKSRFLTWLGYESWFGHQVLHRALYAIYGPNISPPAPPFDP